MGIYEKYIGKKVLVTGHTGFKGGWFVAILNLLGANVLGYALEPEHEACVYNEINGDQKCNSVIADIRNKEKLEEVILDFKPDFIFHLAAQSLVLKSYKLPSETFDVNVVGTSNLLEVVEKLKGKTTVVIITTDKVYENKEWEFPYRENDVLGGYDPYSASKACTELVVSSFRNSFFNLSEISNHNKAIASVRAGNVIGGGDYSENRIIPDIVNSLQSNRKIELRNPKAIRPWQHVLEPLFAYLKLAIFLDESPEKFSGSYNIGPVSHDVLTVEELVQQAIKVWGQGDYFVSSTNKLHEAGILKLDISKIQNLLNWFPVYNSQQAIKNTIDWYKESDKVSFTDKQILDYLNEIS